MSFIMIIFKLACQIYTSYVVELGWARGKVKIKNCFCVVFGLCCG